MALVGGYHKIALPLTHSVFKRYIYVKKHSVKENESNSTGEGVLVVDRTVYIVNLPDVANEDWLRECLEPVGAVQHIVTHGVSSKQQPHSKEVMPNGPLQAKTAHVVFKSKAAVAKILKITALDTDQNKNQSPNGLRGYVAKYKSNRPGLEAVKQIADQYMVAFDAEEEEDLRKREELKNQVDADGFVTVVNTKKRSSVAAEELARPAKKQKAKELDNFYRFQMREKKRDQLKSLRERFEEDRQLVEKLKKANKFKPE